MSDDVYQEVAPSDMTGLDDIYARKSGLKRSPSPRILQGMMSNITVLIVCLSIMATRNDHQNDHPK